MLVAWLTPGHPDGCHCAEPAGPVRRGWLPLLCHCFAQCLPLTPLACHCLSHPFPVCSALLDWRPCLSLLLCLLLVLVLQPSCVPCLTTSCPHRPAPTTCCALFCVVTKTIPGNQFSPVLVPVLVPAPALGPPRRRLLHPPRSPPLHPQRWQHCVRTIARFVLHVCPRPDVLNVPAHIFHGYHAEPDCIACSSLAVAVDSVFVRVSVCL